MTNSCFVEHNPDPLSNKKGAELFLKTINKKFNHTCILLYLITIYICKQLLTQVISPINNIRKHSLEKK